MKARMPTGSDPAPLRQTATSSRLPPMPWTATSMSCRLDLAVDLAPAAPAIRWTGWPMPQALTMASWWNRLVEERGDSEALFESIGEVMAAAREELSRTNIGAENT
jgi:hypothetical protein